MIHNRSLYIYSLRHNREIIADSKQSIVALYRILNESLQKKKRVTYNLKTLRFELHQA